VALDDAEAVEEAVEEALADAVEDAVDEAVEEGEAGALPDALGHGMPVLAGLDAGGELLPVIV
jgi:hypothetical protein